MTPLDLVSTKDLLNALCARFTHTVFSGLIERTVGENEDDTIRVTKMTGCRYVGQALASSLVIKAHERNLEQSEPATEEDL